MTGRYAEGTSVDPSRSRQEIERTLARFNATAFAYGWEGDQAMVGFVVGDRQVRFYLPLPERTDVRTTPGGRSRTTQQIEAALEAETRRRWRALALAIKAKLEVVETGISTFDEEFLAHIVLPDGTQVGPRVLAELEQAKGTGRVAPRMLAIEGGAR